MPSLITVRSNPPTAGSSRPLSKVNSFQRHWEDDEAPKKVGQSSSSKDIEWSSSPEQRTAPTPSIYPTLPDINETAQDRRRKAILAAMAFAVEDSTSSDAIDALVPRAPPEQILPSIPEKPIASGSAVDGKKRALPWDEELSTAKKAQQRNDSTSSKTTKRSDSAASHVSSVNIKQKLTLSTEQQKVLSLVVAEGKNIFFTGSAGTGKSVLLREIIKSLRRKYATAPDAVAVTASTGIAACNIGGVTLHSFGGVGIAVEEANVLVGKIKKNKKAAARWARTKVLIIDEVSMVDGALFDKLCKIGQMLRKQPERPWGGIQIVVTGDFFQLPPVTKGKDVQKFSFEAATWDETISMSVNLTKVFRQKDQRFVDMLNEMRFGKLTPGSIDAFKSLSRPIKYNDAIEPTELFPRREDVDRANNQRLDQLNTDGWSYAAVDGGAITDPVQRDKMLSNFLAVSHLKLQVDAQVMLIKNTDETLVNGSMGKVIGFCHKIAYEVGPTGQWLEDRGWSDLPPEERERKENALSIALAKLGQGATPFPVVQFKLPGGNYRDVLVEYELFKSELPNGDVQVSRSQLPLILSWAMSIHKSQGQTLERVKVDLGKVFEKGQAYVALSRATSLDGLQVLNFNASKVMAHRKVAVWSERLRDLNT